MRRYTQMNMVNKKIKAIIQLLMGVMLFSYIHGSVHIPEEKLMYSWDKIIEPNYRWDQFIDEFNRFSKLQNFLEADHKPYSKINDYDNRSEHVLYQALLRRNGEMLVFLIEHGTDINKPLSNDDHSILSHMTPLQYCEKYCWEMYDLVQNPGLRFNLNRHVCYKQFINIIKILAQAGAKPSLTYITMFPELFVECPMCLVLPGDNAVTLLCKHQFCKGCIDTWKRNTNTCPLCRAEIIIRS